MKVFFETLYCWAISSREKSLSDSKMLQFLRVKAAEHGRTCRGRDSGISPRLLCFPFFFIWSICCYWSKRLLWVDLFWNRLPSGSQNMFLTIAFALRPHDAFFWLLRNTGTGSSKRRVYPCFWRRGGRAEVCTEISRTWTIFTVDFQPLTRDTSWPKFPLWWVL